MELLIIGVLWVNALTFIMARIWWKWHGDLAADLEYEDDEIGDEVRTYLIAGNLNQPRKAFEFLGDLLTGPRAYARFRMRGFSAKDTADAITEDIAWDGVKKARIYTISLGDHVARHLETDLESGVSVYAINPCPWAAVLKFHWLVLLAVLGPILEVFCHALGWLSIVPIIPTVGGKYSLVLLADQYITMIYDLPHNHTGQTLGVCLSSHDEFLNNQAIRHYFPLAKTETVDCGHGDTVGNAQKYYLALEKLLKRV